MDVEEEFIRVNKFKYSDITLKRAGQGCPANLWTHFSLSLRKILCGGRWDFEVDSEGNYLQYILIYHLPQHPGKPYNCDSFQ